MPGVQGKSLLMAKYGKRASDAAQKTAAAEPEFDSFGDLPAGIVGGIAQLVDCRIMPIADGKKGAGELMFFARALVKSPDVHDGVHIRGLGTSIMQNLADDKDLEGQVIQGRSMEDKLALVQEHVKRIAGIQPGVPFDPSPFLAENIEATCQHLKDAQPHIRFRTWKGSEQSFEERGGKWFVVEGEFKGGAFTSNGKLATPFANGQKGIHPPTGYPSQQAAQAAFLYAGKPSRVNHVWSGTVSYTPDVVAGGSMGDNTPKHQQPTTTTNGTTPPKEKAQFRTTAPVATVPEPLPAEGTDTVDGLDPELADLLHHAKAKEDGGLEEAEAQTTLLERAIELGVDQGIIDGPSWDDLVAAIAEKMQEGEGTPPDPDVDDVPAPEEPAEEGPKVGELYFVHWPLDAKGKATINPKTKKPVKLEVEVQTIDPTSRTVTVTDLNTQKPVLAPNKKPRPFSFDALLDK